MDKEQYIKSRKHIDESFCFSTRDNHDCILTQQAFEYYENNKKSNEDWLRNDDTPIFLDTNVLLDIYTLGKDEQDQYLKFLTKNKDRIYLTGQVNEEYSIHRLDSIKDYIDSLNKTKSTISKLRSISELIRAQLKEIEDTKNTSCSGPEFQELSESIEAWLKFINEKYLNDELVKETDSRNKELASKCETVIKSLIVERHYDYKDPVLEIVSTLKILPGISQEEYDFIEKLYNDLLADFEKVKTDVDKKHFLTFPGSGDREKLKEGKKAHGDLIIYHEIMAFILSSQKDAIFLTNDMSKNDWIKTTLQPFPHYIVNSFRMTGKMLYILKASDFLPLAFERSKKESPESKDGEISVQNSSLVNDSGKENAVIEQKTATVQPKYLSITQEQMMSEFIALKNWVHDYGNGHNNELISENYFIYSILGRKKYDYAVSRVILQSLIDEGKLKKEEQKIGNSKFNTLELVDNSTR